MGEYEDRYPESYGRGEPAAPPAPAAPERGQTATEQAQDRAALRHRFGLGTAAEVPRGWEHAPKARPHLVEPAPAPAGALARAGIVDYRGVGPRGYVRSPQRIYEDICDRLAENPFIDASDIAVLVSGSEVRLSGSVDSAVVAHEAETIARQVIGVSLVRNELRLHQPAEASDTARARLAAAR